VCEQFAASADTMDSSEQFNETINNEINQLKQVLTTTVKNPMAAVSMSTGEAELF
jgi:hypothetical protein